METLNQFAYAWWDWMAAMFWQASLLIVVVGAIDLLIRRWVWPQVRHVLWLLVFVKLLIPPFWSLPTAIVPGLLLESQERLARQWERRFPVPSQPAGAVKTATPAGKGDAAKTNAAASPAPTASGRKIILQVWLLALWASGVVLFLGFLSLRMAKLRRWHQSQRTRKTIPEWFHELLVQTGLRLELGRLPAIVFSREAVTPAVYGVLRPVLLLPEHYLEHLSREEAEHILLHELCHLKRGDLWLHAAALLLQIVYWFNPLLLWAARQLRHAREICCDQTLAARLGDGVKAYRQTLLKAARELLTERVEPGLGLLGVFEEPFWLVTRLRWLERQTWRHRRAAMAASVLVIMAMGLLVMPMALSPVTAGLLGEEASLIQTGHPALPVQAERVGPAVPPEKAYYCLQVVRETTYLLWIRTGSRIRSYDETWFDRSRVAQVEGHLSYILDRGRGRFWLVNHRRRTCLEAPLPVPRGAFWSPELERSFTLRRQSGTVEATGERMEILGRPCREHRLVTWSALDPEPERTVNYVWTTRDVPFDITLFDDFIFNLRQLVSPKDNSLHQEMLRRMSGLQMRIDLTGGQVPWRRQLVSTTVEMSRKVPPPGLFEIPPDYTRKELLEPSDLE